jgi:type III restriction enzyme
LQTEIESETGVQFGGRIKNKADRRRVKLTKNLSLDPAFREIWDRIKYKTRYRVQVSETKLIELAASELEQVTIHRPRVSAVKARVEMSREGVKAREVSSGAPVLAAASTGANIPDVLGKIAGHARLTRQTVMAILRQADKLAAIATNPQQVIDEAARIITRCQNQLMVDGIKYEKIAGAEWSMRLFEAKELELYLDNLLEVRKRDKTVYDYIPVDSDTERSFAAELDSRDDVKFYFKLPPWFKIETPLGKYNPDWAIVFDGDSRVYFVAETKDTNDINNDHLGTSERLKILSGRAHFAANGSGGDSGSKHEVVFRAPVKTFADVIHDLPGGEQ